MWNYTAYIVRFFLRSFRHLWARLCHDITPPVHLSFSILVGFVLSCVWTLLLLCEHTYCISHSQTSTHSPTDGCGAVEGVCASVCVGNVVPRISITGSRPGVSPHTKDAGRLEALGLNRGRDRRGKRKSASARSVNSILTYISQSSK